MTAIAIDPVCRRRIQPRNYCRNSQLVSAQLQIEMASTLNQIARYRTKEYFRSCGDVTFRDGVTNKVWRFGGHIGPMAGTMIVRVLMAPATQVTSANNPYMTLTLSDTSGNTLATARAHLGYSYGAVPQEVPQEWGVATLAINTAALRDSGFRAVVQANEEARPISCTAYEYALRPDSDNGYVNQQYAAGQPILDVDRSAQQALAHSLYKRGGPKLFGHSSDSDAVAAVHYAYTGATYTNIFVNPIVEKIDPHTGFVPDLSFCNRKTVSTIPVKFACYAGMSAGTGTVRVTDEFGNVYATFSITGAAAWQTELTGNLPNDRRRYYIEHKSDGVNTLTTYALTCFVYMA